jgi:RNA polymerase sigma-70 factor (ECF subfamily)
MQDAGTGVVPAAEAERDSCNDAALIAQSLGAPERFAALFDRHAPAIRGYVARRLGPDAAEDLVGEVFLIAFERRAAYNGAYDSARPWLYGIATNLIGRRRRDEVRLFRAIARLNTPPAAELVADQVAGRVAAQAIRSKLASALAGLSRAHRDVLLLIASGLSVEETAAALEVPRGTIASRLARARRKVRAELGDTNPIDTLGE